MSVCVWTSVLCEWVVGGVHVGVWVCGCDIGNCVVARCAA